jgi:hypothetical protein
MGALLDLVSTNGPLWDSALSLAIRNRHTAAMTLEGWDHVPLGYGARFDLAAAPWWLRWWFNTPFVDRYAYPRLVARGLGYLTPHPGWPEEGREPVQGGWRVGEPGSSPPGSWAPYKRDQEPGR